MATVETFSGQTGTWCPGCGDWGIGISIKQAFSQMGLEPSSVCVVFDIGCSGNMNDVLNAYAMHGLHGRSLTYAVGMKMANHKLPVVAVGGDGGLYGEGGNHFLHACRGNHDITMLVHDNSVYGLTTGQVAPTAFKGFKSKSTPDGIIEVNVNPLALALTQGATFIAQAFAGDVGHLISMIKAGMEHKGFSLVNVLQPCVTFNKVNTYQYYMKRVYKLPADYDNTNFKSALEKTIEVNEEKYPLGIIYKNDRPAFHELLPQIKPDIPLINNPPFKDLELLMDEFI